MIEKKILAICREIQDLLGSVIERLVGDWYVMAALRMNGGVKPQHRPTMRKDRT